MINGRQMSLTLQLSFRAKVQRRTEPYLDLVSAVAMDASWVYPRHTSQLKVAQGSQGEPGIAREPGGFATLFGIGARPRAMW